MLHFHVINLEFIVQPCNTRVASAHRPTCCWVSTFGHMKFRFLWLFLPGKQKIASNDREVRKLEGSKNQEGFHCLYTCNGDKTDCFTNFVHWFKSPLFFSHINFRWLWTRSTEITINLVVMECQTRTSRMLWATCTDNEPGSWFWFPAPAFTMSGFPSFSIQGSKGQRLLYHQCGQEYLPSTFRTISIFLGGSKNRVTLYLKIIPTTMFKFIGLKNVKDGMFDYDITTTYGFLSCDHFCREADYIFLKWAIQTLSIINPHNLSW